MILTGAGIIAEQAQGNIAISDFSLKRVNPNSYNYRLGYLLKVPRLLDGGEQLEFETIELPSTGYVLQGGTMYLGHTLESIGSSKFAMSLIGRSSLGRLGLFLQVSANLGHTTSNHCWTLELVASQAIRLYPGMPIGQVSFWLNQGSVRCHGKNLALFNDPHEIQR